MTDLNFLDKALIGSLTVGQFRDLMSELLEAHRLTPVILPKPPKYVHGYNGIKELFNCSHNHAHYLKNHVIQDAIIQNGRKIMVDVEKAIELFNSNNGGRK